MLLVYDTSGCSSQGFSWSPSNRYLDRSKLASTRLCNSHIIMSLASIWPQICTVAWGSAILHFKIYYLNQRLCVFHPIYLKGLFLPVGLEIATSRWLQSWHMHRRTRGVYIVRSLPDSLLAVWVDISCTPRSAVLQHAHFKSSPTWWTRLKRHTDQPGCFCVGEPVSLNEPESFAVRIRIIRLVKRCVEVRHSLKAFLIHSARNVNINIPILINISLF